MEMAPARKVYALLFVDVAVVIAAFAANVAVAESSPPLWVRDAVSAAYERTLVTTTNLVPAFVADILPVFVGLVATIAILLALELLKRTRRRQRWLVTALLFAQAATVYGVSPAMRNAWMDVRAYDVRWLPPMAEGAKYTRATLRGFASAIAAEGNRIAPLAHAERVDEDTTVTRLYRAWLPVVRRLGVPYDPVPPHPKHLFFEPYGLEAEGAAGESDAYTLEVVLAHEMSRYDRPMVIAHEWTHTVGFFREADADYAAAVACLRSHDPIIEYSAVLWLERLLRAWLAHASVSSLVLRDVNDVAGAEHFNARKARAWSVGYDAYLRDTGQHGMAAYGEYVKMLVVDARDQNGLPILRN